MHPNDGRVVSNFIMQALQGKPISIYGDGSQTRSFCYVDDLVELMLRFMRNDHEFCGPLNMGNPGEFTILELAQHVIELTGSPSEISFETLPNDDPRQRKPDITVAQTRYGWEPQVRLRDGLTLTSAYFKKLLASGELREK
jgi:UDP-glucuronate decarboxylase